MNKKAHNLSSGSTSLPKKRSGVGYLFHGLSLAIQPGIKRFVMIPLLANILVIGSTLYYLMTNLNGWIDDMLSGLPTWLDWLSYVLWPLLAITLFIAFGYVFSTIANAIAAPFNGLLSEKVEAHLLGDTTTDNSSVSDMIKEIPRSLGRELQKLKYTLPRTIGLFLFLLIPGLGQTIGPFIWFAFGSWMWAIHYIDLPFDNNQSSFTDSKQWIKQRKTKALTFGSLITLGTAIPFLNLFIMPIAVCGATSLYVSEYRQDK
ncbi:sulfate transporter CysZ [Vibrio sp.]|nr:sulfate transporter CysZ [Vibrio sp.]